MGTSKLPSAATLQKELDQARRQVAELQEVRARLEEKEREIDRRSQQMASMLNGINEVIYVADPETYELLFVNDAFKEAFGDTVGQICHKVLQNLNAPCEFCTNHLIFGPYKGRSYIWEWQNKINGRWYRCIDKAIPWPDGREVRYEMAIDVTDFKQADERVQQLSQEVLELSTPVIQVWPQVVVAPLIGTLDSQRTQNFMDRFLDEIVAQRARFALVDITGVPTVDTITAQHLIAAVSAARLLGTEVILTGVRPAIAQTLVHLGIDLSNIQTRSSLAAGLRIALNRIGVQLVTGAQAAKES